MLTRSKYFATNVDVPSMEPASKKKRTKKAHVVVQQELKPGDDSVDQSLQQDSQSQDVSSKKWQPKNWEILYNNIRQMRSGGDAPVDSVGCEKSFDVKASPIEQRFQVLISLMLSSQTRDEVNNAACVRLRDAGLSPQMILSIDPGKLAELIKPVSFYKRKVDYLKRTCDILMKDYGGDIPDTVEGLCSLPGVGPKMAHLVMQIAWDQVTGIAVDTHVHRISNRLKFVRKPTKEPTQTEKELEDWLPKDLWKEYNTILVGFGQTICNPIKPKCSQCLNRNLCPSSTAKERKK